MKGENRLIIIGIDKYARPGQQLHNAVFDALRIKKVLEERYEFTVTVDPILDNEATRKAIKEALHIAEQTSCEDDNLIIYYAGHGIQNARSNKGSWVPIDGESHRANCISHSDVLDDLESIEAKHILLISDSCFSGTFISRRRGINSGMSIEELEKRPSKWVFVSGGEETVKDGVIGQGSPFGRSVYEFLANNEKAAFPAEEMFNSVIASVSAKVPQVPNADFIQSETNDGGQMIFRLSSIQSTMTEMALRASLPLPKFELSSSNYIARTIRPYSEKTAIPGDPVFKDSPVFLKELLHTNRKIMLLGSAGSGKSIELQYLAISLASPGSGFIPVYIRLNTFNDQDIETMLPETWSEVNQEMGLIFLDGLDEIPVQQFNTAVRRINLFNEKFPNLRLIASCRTNFYELPNGAFTGTLPSFSVYILNDISLADVKTYASQQYDIDADRFLHDAYDQSYLDIIQKPYFLDILAAHYKKHRGFSMPRSAIIEENLKVQFEKRKTHFESEKLSGDFVFFLLEKVAFVMEMMGKNVLDDNELEFVFAGSNVKATLKNIPSFNFDVSSGKWQFDHNNIQEYLASRILGRLTFDQLISTISFPESKKVKPGWANTLSFFISIGPEDTYLPLLDWLLIYDKEFIVKFEPERIPKDIRINVVIAIFNFYTERGILIRSNKFSGKELARLGAFREILVFLTAILRDNGSNRVSKLNALYVLDHFQLLVIGADADQIGELLIDQFDSSTDDFYFDYSVFHALANLKVTDEAQIERIVSKFSNDTNEYRRAGLYKFLIEANRVDRYLSVFLNGLNLNELENSIRNRGTVRLMDENFYLLEGLKQVKTVAGLKSVLAFFEDPTERRQLYSRDLFEVIDPLLVLAKDVYSTDTSIFEGVYALYLAAGKRSDDELAKMISIFFKLTNTTSLAFERLWEHAAISDYERHSLAYKLLTSDTIIGILNGVLASKYSETGLATVHQLLIRNEKEIAGATELIDQIERFASKNTKLSLSRPSYPDWAAISKQKDQINFNTLFDISEMSTEIAMIFESVKSDVLEPGDLYELRAETYNASENIEDVFTLSALELLRDLAFERKLLDKDEILNWLKGEEFFYYQGIEMYKYLKRSNDLNVSDGQEAFLISWTEVTVKTLHLDDFWANDNTLVMVLWYYIRRYRVRLDKQVLLAFTLYYDFDTQFKINNPGTIEALEEHLPKPEIIKRVIINLSTIASESLSWINNAVYAVKERLPNVDQIILQHLAHRVNNEYKYGEFLKFWITFTEKPALLKDLILLYPTEWLNRDALRLLIQYKKEGDFVVDHLKEILQGENHHSLDNRMFAANLLMSLDKIEGLKYIDNLLIDEGSFSEINESRVTNFDHITNREGIPIFFRMLEVSASIALNDFKISFFRSKLHDGIYNIGISSEDNYLYVKAAILEFIGKHGGVDGSYSYLNSIIIKMEEQLLWTRSQEYNIQDALHEYSKISSF